MMACYCRVSTHRHQVDSQKADILRWLTGHAVANLAKTSFPPVRNYPTVFRTKASSLRAWQRRDSGFSQLIGDRELIA